MTQIQLSDAQAIILSTACAREDAMVFPVTANLKGGAVGIVCKSLLKHGLIEETPATDLNSVYRHDEERGPLTLRATPFAYSTLGITDDPGAQAEDPAQGIATAAPVHRRSGTKQEAVIAMLRAEGGATIEEIVARTCWQPHTVRGAMSGALKKKLGLTIMSEKVDGRGRVYRVQDHG
jgi:hypothetical protein